MKSQWRERGETHGLNRKSFNESVYTPTDKSNIKRSSRGKSRAAPYILKRTHAHYIPGIPFIYNSEVGLCRKMWQNVAK